jgi:hypothetical protein
VDGAETAQNRVVLDHHMTGQRDLVGEDDTVPDPAVMCDMGAGHDQAAVPDPGLHAAPFGADVHGDVFADYRVPADRQPRRFALVFAILRRVAERGEGIDRAAAAGPRAPGDNDVGEQSDAGLEFHLGSDMAIGTDRNAVPYPCPRLDDCGGVYGGRHQRSRIIAA